MAEKVTGGCACRSIRYQLLDKPMFVHCCHCDDCQRLTGSAFVLNAIIETHAIKLLRGKPVPVPVPRDNGPHDIYRCPKCQTALWSDYGRRPNLRFVRVGTLDKPGALKPDVHIYTRWKAKWLKLPKRTPSFRDYYNTSKLWPKASLKRLNAALAVTDAKQRPGSRRWRGDRPRALACQAEARDCGTKAGDLSLACQAVVATKAGHLA